MDKIIIEGSQKLSGNVKISGAKNAVLPIMAASILGNGNSVITRVPDLRDTRTMIRLLEIIGAKCTFSNGKLIINGSNVDNPEAPYELVKTMRASFYVMGPLLAKFGEVRVSLPGGCAWGPRPVDFHLKGFEKLGAEIILESGYIIAKAKRLKGSEISFDFPSVGATGNILMAAVLAEGKTIIRNAAKEPEIVQLCEFLNLMGANIIGVGSSNIVVEGVETLSSADIDIIPDRIEAGTFLIAGALLGEITLDGINSNHLLSVILKLRDAGCELINQNDSITIKPAKSINPVDISTAVFPGFPTDLQAQWVGLMTLAKGSSIITDNVYKDRFSHIPELNRLGAKIKVDQNSAWVKGVNILKGAQVMSTDIRASAALIIGGLVAHGITEVQRVYHIDRGYERIEEKFSLLGAKINRVSA
ncbi:MAG: UDP-N-acetylglucosamine 1-carboxyvinyltransferase [Candidatus Marinimicrobia bacterium]|nr:UDP-N-acetylglucosamine 1-carboxyvinyltransferase [Candidatus Neomarinimicrobiota bacterium]